MVRTWLVLALLCAGTARAECPSCPIYSAAGLVNTWDYTAGPFAPNSAVSLFGTLLARSRNEIGTADLRNGMLPVELNYVRVYVDDQPAPILFVSYTQINFLMPSVEVAGPVRVRVAVEGSTGPEITVTLLDSAPVLHPMADGYCLATDAYGKLLTADAPAHANDTVVVYVTGLGHTTPNPGLGEIPQVAAVLLKATLDSLKVALNGTTLDPVRIKYAGVTPGWGGLYQINIVLPDGTGPDPEIRVSVGNLPAQAGLKLALR